MAAAVRFIPPSPDVDRNITWPQDDAGSRPVTRGYSKAEKLLGMLDNGTGPVDQRGGSSLLSTRRLLRKQTSNITTAFADLKGMLTLSPRSASGGRFSPRTPGFGHYDSDSITSAVSPTFDPAGSTSTLPSVYDSPTALQHASRRVSAATKESRHHADGPGWPGPNDHHYQHSPYASEPAPPPVVNQRPVATSSPGLRLSTWHELPPLDLPPLSPTPTAPKSRPLSQISRSKSASRRSSTSEYTLRGKWPRWKGIHTPGGTNNKEHPSGAAPPTLEMLETSEPEPLLPIPPRLLIPKSGKNVQDWLEKAELDRSPSTTINSSMRIFTSNSSSASVRTLTSNFTTQTDGARRSELDISQWPLRSPTRSNPNKNLSKICKTDLLMESVLSLSSSDEEDNGNEIESGNEQLASPVSWGQGSGNNLHSAFRNASIASESTFSSKGPQWLSVAENTATKSQSQQEHKWYFSGKQRFRSSASRLAATSSISAPSSAMQSPVKESHFPEYSISQDCKSGHATPKQDAGSARAGVTSGADMLDHHQEMESRQIESRGGDTLASSSVGEYEGVKKGDEEDKSNANAGDEDRVPMESSPQVAEGFDFSGFPAPPPTVTSPPTPTPASHSGPPPLAPAPAPPVTAPRHSIMLTSSRESTPRPFEFLLAPPPTPPTTMLLGSAETSRNSSISSAAISLPQELYGSSETAHDQQHDHEVPLSLGLATKASVVNTFTSTTAMMDGNSFLDGSQQPTALLSRKRTISNVPIYVTGLEESSERDMTGDEKSVATFVFSNIF